MQSELLNELFIQNDNSINSIALLQNKKLVEIHNENLSNNYSVGDIYIGKIKKIMLSLNAIFIDIGYHKDAFLHYHDLGANIFTFLYLYDKFKKNNNYNNNFLKDINFKDPIDKNGVIKNIFNVNQIIPVQIVKEPIANKGPRLSTLISITGRYIILFPLNNNICISRRIIKESERYRLKNLITRILPKNFGVIIRTIAENKNYSDLKQDLDFLLKKWESCVNNMKNSLPKTKIIGESNHISIVLRDILTPFLSSIYVDNNVIYDQVFDYVNNVSPKQKNIVKLHKENVPLFEKFGINKQIKSLFGSYVYINGGSYIVIEHTEAMHVIDVNSGYNNSNIDQEDNALQVNLDAAKEIARQLRLRDMGGIIVVDFIDMYKVDNKKIIFDKLKEYMIPDKAKHTILPLSKFGIMQITRQRIKPTKNISTIEKCPSCKGSGQIEASILIIDEIYNKLSFILKEKKYYSISIHVHPYIKSYLSNGFLSIRLKWIFKFKVFIYIKSFFKYHINEYYIYDNILNKKILI